MEIDTTIWPIPRETLAGMVKHTKSLPDYDNARPVIELLEFCFRGVNNSEAFDMIDSITAHFKEEVEKRAAEKAIAYVEKLLRAQYNSPELFVNDEQMAKSIMLTVKDPLFESKRDWGGIYIILASSYCKLVTSYKELERKVDGLKKSKLLKNIPKDKDFDYGSLQKGIDTCWPKTHQEWLKKTDGDKTFVHRLDVANLFLKHLKDCADTEV